MANEMYQEAYGNMLKEGFYKYFNSDNRHEIFYFQDGFLENFEGMVGLESVRYEVNRCRLIKCSEHEIKGIADELESKLNFIKRILEKTNKLLARK